MNQYDLNEEDQAYLERLSPVCVVVKKNAEGDYEGLIEASFSMDFDKKTIRMWWSGKAYSMLGEHIINGEEDARGNAIEHEPTYGRGLSKPLNEYPLRPGYEIFNIMDDNLPVTINVKRWLESMRNPDEYKYYKRNALFTIKENKQA